MNSIFLNYEPQTVLRYFEAIAAIPHGSGNTRAISDYVLGEARRHGYRCRQDAADNVVVFVPAAAGYEAAEPLILQGHIDMVCEKESDCPLDMAKEPIRLRVEGDWVSAEGTTLGGDDGVAVAMMLALMEESLPHPALELIFTADEETGMDGAVALDCSDIKGRRLLNLDSEEEGVFTVSCAGGNRTHCILPFEREPVSGQLFEITLGGLTGGHSGAEINKGFASANVLMGRLLTALLDAGARLAEVNGGMQDNAIPRECRALVLLPEAPDALLKKWETVFRGECSITEKELFVGAEPKGEATCDALLPEDARRVAEFLLLAPSGVQAMSFQLPGLVQTSLNLGVLRTHEGRVEASFCVRSSLGSEKELLTQKLTVLTERLGGRVEVTGSYPAWEFRSESDFRELLVDVYRDQTGKEPRVEAIHAGLECGLFCGKLPGLDCVSMGPELHDIHTPRERMSIASVGRIWDFVKEVLRRAR